MTKLLSYHNLDRHPSIQKFFQSHLWTQNTSSADGEPDRILSLRGGLRNLPYDNTPRRKYQQQVLPGLVIFNKHDRGFSSSP